MAPESARSNVDVEVVEGFGEEWSRFTNEALDEGELAAIFEQYTSVFPWERLGPDAVGFDAGCGSGRWARFFAPRVGTLHCVDASEQALAVARRQLTGARNVEFHHSDLNSMVFPPASMDFGYSLGVLHHIPDTRAALDACTRLLKPGAPFLVYLYYSIEESGAAKRRLFRAVSAIRRKVSRLPARPKQFVCDVIAGVVYWPLARLARLLELAGGDPARVPLSYYRRRSFYVMRNDALDRFGTRLEQRFTRAEVVSMLEGAGLTDIVVSDHEPFWTAVGIRAA